jgi:hypothetical protein
MQPVTRRAKRFQALCLLETALKFLYDGIDEPEH